MRGDRATAVVAVIVPLSTSDGTRERLNARAREVGLREVDAVAVRLNRVAIEILLREQLTTTAARESVIPRLLARRVLLVWLRPTAGADHQRAWEVLAAEPGAVAAALVPDEVRTWVTRALEGGGT
ncbi:hypothetical protein [Actinoalloteichus caeruleus]|uniref:hypothetical protein n=2 Tax=Actinoalloteichus cyanogriseus TaxID=2893586 RepID=UPI0004BE8A52|nr:hypothetical protein [Actinoalloteichus caeruleus]